MVAAGLAGQAEHGLARDPEAAAKRVRSARDLADALDGAAFVQENAPETVEAKLPLFRELDRLASPDVILASSTSAIVASRFTAELPGRARCLVAHPVNPPHLVPIVELSGAPWTAPETIARAKAVYESIGQVPIVVRKEIEGFIVNRLQGALLAEAFRLVGEGFVSPQDLDKTMKDGLGLRWSFMGPFETIELNAPGGMPDYCARYTGFYRSLQSAPAGPEVFGPSNVQAAPARMDRGARIARGSMPVRAGATAGWRRCAPTRLRRRGHERLSSQAPRRIKAANEETLMANRKVIITCAVTGRDPHAVDVAAPADHAGRDRRCRDRRRRGGRRHHPPARAQSAERPAGSDAGGVHARSCRASSSSSNCVINLTSGGSPTMKVEERVRPAAELQAGSREPQHGLDQLRRSTRCSTATRSSSTTGSGPISKARATSCSATRSRTSSTSSTTCAGNNTRFEFECYDIAPPLQPGAFPRSRPGQAAAVRAVGVRHSGRHRHPSRRRHDDAAHRRPAVRRQVPLVGARRRPQSDADRRHGGRHGWQRARRARGLTLDRARQARRIERRSRSRNVRKIIEGLGLEVANPDEAREILSLKGGDKVGF